MYQTWPYFMNKHSSFMKLSKSFLNILRKLNIYHFKLYKYVTTNFLYINYEIN